MIRKVAFGLALVILLASIIPQWKPGIYVCAGVLVAMIGSELLNQLQKTVRGRQSLKSVNSYINYVLVTRSAIAVYLLAEWYSNVANGSLANNPLGYYMLSAFAVTFLAEAIADYITTRRYIDKLVADIKAAVAKMER